MTGRAKGKRMTKPRTKYLQRSLPAPGDATRNLFGIGAIGNLVTQVQQALNKGGFYTSPCDGWYGAGTAKAVTNFQTVQSLRPTGLVDETTWTVLMRTAVPPVSARSLQLTASFENHGFGLAVGNFDGALLTWGIIGFTLRSGRIPKIILEVNQRVPEKVQEAFGSYSAELIRLMQASAKDQTSWAVEHTLPNGRLAEPWRSMVAAFGSYPEAQQEQLRCVNDDYLVPGIAAARKLGFSSELGLALCFDIQVQNGGIKPEAMAEVRVQQQKSTSEPELRVVVANAVADYARAAWREDVRRRKLTIAIGNGTVHGHSCVLENWGLCGDVPAVELIAQAT
jgi:hypothetical protein